jgi:hypothetical protein
MSQYAKARQAQRKPDFKKGIQVEDARKKREENTVQIRKDKRNESFQKRRNVDIVPKSDGMQSFDQSSAVAVCSLSLAFSFLSSDSQNPDNLALLVEMIRKPDLRSQLEATTAIRKLLSMGMHSCFRRFLVLTTRAKPSNPTSH